MNEAYIFDAIRTPRGKGKAEGAFYEVKPIELLAGLLKSIEERNKLDTKQIDDMLIGCVTPIDDQGADIAKAALLYAGWDENVAGVQLNRFCASGLEAVNMAAMKIRSAHFGDFLPGSAANEEFLPDFAQDLITHRIDIDLDHGSPI